MEFPTMQTPAKQGAKAGDAYWEKFEELLRRVAAQEPDAMLTLRKAGMARFAETGFPTVNDEDWRFTNVSPIEKLPFHPTLDPPRTLPGPNAVRELTFAGVPGRRLVFVDGHYAPQLSNAAGAELTAKVANLASISARDSDVLARHLGRHARMDANPFVALNIAFFTDGALVHIPAGVELREPIHLVHLSTSSQPSAATHLRHLIVAEPGSKATLLESYVSAPGAARLTNVAVELVIGEGARVEHCKFQDESPNAFHIASLHAELGAHCDFVLHSLALGARLSRNSIQTVLGGEGVDCILNGLYLTKDDQLADHHMVVEHAQPRCNSHEYFNGILDGRSRDVFHGRILVRPDAQKTDAKQTNKNLLLSDDAGVNSKPQLEIYADDVKCTHGATIGQLNEESIFYLRARGISLETARRMLMHAFAGEITERIRHEFIREELDKLLWERLEQNRLISMAH